MADAFDLLDDAVTTDKGTIYDYPASVGESFAGGLERALDTNPLALVGRQARYLYEDFQNLAGEGERVDQKTAEDEVKRRGLDLKIPVGGISRVELDMLQYLKQREVSQNTVAARSTALGTAAGFAGGLAGSFVDPLNIASNFIPFVPEARYARWLAQAGESTLARAAARVGAGAIEGAAGAALVEPLVYGGATSEQLDYGLMDSFLNVAFGGVMGGGLHVAGGGIYDYRATRALATFADGLSDAITLRQPPMPDHLQQEVLQQAVHAMETGGEVRAQEFIDAWHGSPHTFDRFDNSRIGSGEGNQTEGVGHYLASTSAYATDYRVGLSAQQLTMEERSAAKAIDAAGGDRARAVERIAKDIAERYPNGKPRFGEVGRETYDRLSETLALLKSDAEIRRHDGALYQVRINATLSDLLDLEKPLSEQSDKVREALSDQYEDSATGRQILEDLGHDNSAPTRPNPEPDEILGDPQKNRDAAAYLRSLGIKGTTYTAQGERSYVIFDDKDLEIVTRNGEPINKAQRPPSDLAGLMAQSKADRSQGAFDRQFVQDGRAPEPPPEPKDPIERAKADEAAAAEMVEAFRQEGRLTAEDEAELKAVDKAAAKAELRAQAFEAAAACMVTA